LSNAIKHSQEEEINIGLGYLNNKLTLQLVDYGIGFSVNSEKNKIGNGMNNIKERTELINGVGTSILKVAVQK